MIITKKKTNWSWSCRILHMILDNWKCNILNYWELPWLALNQLIFLIWHSNWIGRLNWSSKNYILWKVMANCPKLMRALSKVGCFAWLRRKQQLLHLYSNKYYILWKRTRMYKYTSRKWSAYYRNKSRCWHSMSKTFW